MLFRFHSALIFYAASRKGCGVLSYHERASGGSGAGVTKKSPLTNFEVSFVYNCQSIRAIIMKFGTRFRRSPPEPCAKLHDDSGTVHYIMHDFVLTDFR